jgi:hypothetical protein
MRCSCGRENDRRTNPCPHCGRRLIWGFEPQRLLLDSAVLLALLVALAVVFLLDRGQPGVSAAVEASDVSVPARPLRLAVTPPRYDDMGKLLDSLGSGYHYTQIKMEDLLDAEQLQKFDVVFLTGGESPDEWVGRQTGPAEREAAGVFRVRPEIVARLRKGLRRYVGGGGTLYVSDWQFLVMAIAFPEYIDRAKSLRSLRGAVQTVQAEVIDPGLQKRLGQSIIDLKFDKTVWQPGAFDDSKVTALIRSQYQTVSGEARTAPLLAQFPFKDGNVIFTSFHNEKQNSQTELELLRYLVFTAVNAQLDAAVRRTMIHGGFSPVERNLLSASGTEQSLRGTYDCRGGKSLQFVLGFEDRGARLRLTVTPPEGAATQTQEGASTFTIEVPHAPEGKWRYTVTPVEVPYPNFPFSVTVGEK